MIRYIVGPSNSGKSQLLHQMIGERLGKVKQLLLVPEQYTLQAEIELINDLELEGIIDVEVMSFNRLCTRVINDTGDLIETEINSLGKAMVLRSILDKHAEELQVFSEVSKKTGFIDKLTTLLSEMKRVGVDTETLKSKLSSVGDHLLERKLNDVMVILNYYNEFMLKGYFDEEDKLLAVISRLKDAEILNQAVVYYDGFDSFSNQEYQLIKAMIVEAKASVFALAIDTRGRNEIYSPVLRTYNKLREIAKNLDIKESMKEVLERDDSSDLNALKHEFFSYPYHVYDQEVTGVSLHMNNNLYDEIELVARDIILQTRQGYRYKDMLVITGQIEVYASIIKRIFGEYNIPYFIDEKVSVMNHPIIKFILSSLRCINSGFKKSDVISVLKTGLTDVEESNADGLENYILANGLRGNQWLEAFEDDVLEDSREKLISKLMLLKSELPLKATIADMTKSLFKYLIETEVPEKIESWIQYLKDENALDKVGESTQIWHTVIEIFDQLIELEGQDTKTLKEYIRILEAGFREVTLGLIPPSIDQVVVGSVERSKSKSVKGLYIIGLNDGVIPKKYSDEGILLDDEKLLLKENGLDLETDSGSIIARDAFSTFSALAKAENFVRFSFALSDKEGKALRPSIYVDKLSRIFTQLEVKSHVLEGVDPLDAFNPMTHYKSVTEHLRLYADDHKIDENWFAVLAWYKKNMPEKTARLEEAIFYDNQIESIPKNLTNKLYELPLTSSVSRLERFSRCPFSHFVHYGLKPKRRDEFELRLPDIGSLFHQSLERFDALMKEEKEDWMTIEKARTFELIDRIVDELVDGFNSNILMSSHRFKYLIKKLKRVGKRAAWTLVTQVKQGEFMPYAHEIKFSTKGIDVVPPIMVELSNGQRMMLEGQIDRIDIYEHQGKKYIKIIDYKSGSKKFSMSEVYQGLQLQLMVYMEAVLENHDYFGAETLNPAGVFYFKIDDPLLESEILQGEMTESEILKALKMDGMLVEDLTIARAMDKGIIEDRKSSVIPFELKKDDTISSRSKTLVETDFYRLIEHVTQTVKSIGDEITDGVTKIDPIKVGTKTGCQSCDYKSICQFDQSFGNTYRNLKTLKDEEVIEKIKEGDQDA